MDSDFVYMSKWYRSAGADLGRKQCGGPDKNHWKIITLMNYFSLGVRATQDLAIGNSSHFTQQSWLYFPDRPS